MLVDGEEFYPLHHDDRDMRSLSLEDMLEVRKIVDYLDSNDAFLDLHDEEFVVESPYGYVIADVFYSTGREEWCVDFRRWGETA